MENERKMKTDSQSSVWYIRPGCWCGYTVQ